MSHKLNEQHIDLIMKEANQFFKIAEDEMAETRKAKEKLEKEKTAGMKSLSTSGQGSLHI